jgi:galactokinase
MDAGLDGWGENAPLARLVRALLQAQGPSASELSVALHIAPPTYGPDALLAATASAAIRAIAARSEAEEGGVAAGAEAVSEVLKRPLGPALLLAASEAGSLVLVDTATHEAEALPEPDHMGWGFVDTRRASEPAGSLHRQRRGVLDAAVADLRRSGFEGLRSLRGLDHRDVPDALDSLRGEAKRIVRYLAGEDRRVQRLLVALRKGDGQVVGAHLLMSEASRRDDWQASTPEAEFVVREVEEAEGIYGARTVGGGVGGGLLVVGRPFLVPPFLDALAERFEAEFGIRPATSVL